MTDPRYPVQPPQGYYRPQPQMGWQPPPAYMMPRTAAVPVETNHILHLILTLLTCGLWAPVWLVMVAVNSGRTKTTYYM